MKLDIHYYTHENQQLSPILSQINLVHINSYDFFLYNSPICA
jgi:hypothetical protein